MVGHTIDVNDVNIGKGLVPMIDMQLLNDALLAVVVAVGIAIALSISIVAASALTRRIERNRRIREIERHLATVAEHQSASAR
jgi:hypothetical protein